MEDGRGRHATQEKHMQIISTLSSVIFLLIALLLWSQSETIGTWLYPPAENAEVSTTTPPFLTEQEVVIIPPKKDSATSSLASSTPTSTPIILPITPTLFQYVEVRDSCGVHYQGDCVVARSGPGLDFPTVARLRNAVVLKIDGEVVHDGHTWYKIIFDEYLRYPERITSDWYVAADYVDVLYDEGDKNIWDNDYATTSKHIIVDRNAQKLYAYDGDTLFLESDISTGLELSPTPRGTFVIYKKTPSRYMQGPLPGLTDVYDLPGVPWNLYFTHEGAVIHGAYWHDSFGHPYSHGCVNLPPETAHELYTWADLGTPVTVQ
jgi:lipoprotein-anchoring transpeptidase ErfK/SrfK